MDTSRTLRAAFAAAAIGCIGTLSGTASAADEQQGAAAPAADEKVTELEGLTVLGSRRYDRSSDTETPVPVDMTPSKPGRREASDANRRTIQGYENCARDYAAAVDPQPSAVGEAALRRLAATGFRRGHGVLR